MRLGRKVPAALPSLLIYTVLAACGENVVAPSKELTRRDAAPPDGANTAHGGQNPRPGQTGSPYGPGHPPVASGSSFEDTGPTCASRSDFDSKVNPVLASDCISCHAPGGIAAGVLPMAIGPQGVEENYRTLRRYIAGDVNDNVLLLKVGGNVPHGPNTRALLPEGSARFEDVRRWVADETQCLTAHREVASARFSSDAFRTRVQRLLPSSYATHPSYDYEAYLGDRGGNPETVYDPMMASGMTRLFASEQRRFSAEVLLGMRIHFHNICSFGTLKSDAHRFFDMGDANIPAALLPPDPSVQKALLAARNAWDYPFAADDAEVQALARLHREALNTRPLPAGVTSSEKLAAHSVCMAALMAPQFWLGVARRDDGVEALKRASYEILAVRPAMRELEAIRAAPDKATYVRAYLASRAQGDRKAAFIKRVQDWQREWYGLRPFLDRTGWEHVRGHYGPGMYGASATASIGMTVAPPEASHTIKQRFVAVSSSAHMEPYQVSHAEVCDRNKDQVFDPESNKLQWEFYNTRLGRYETLATWEKDGGGTWREGTGGLTRSDGSVLVTGLADIVATQKITGPGYDANKLYFRGGVLKGSEFDALTEKANPPTLRLRRFGADGTVQDGVSEIALWYSGERVRVCNAMSRFPLACAYRSSRAGFGTVKVESWSARTSHPLMGYTTHPPSFFNPQILDDYRCGIPDPSEIDRQGTAGYDEDRAFPRGTKGNTATLAAHAMSWDRTLGSATITPEKFTKPEDQQRLRSPWPELRAVGRLLFDAEHEPDALLAHILENGLPYGTLLTAPYTLGRAEWELALRTQGFYFPTHPRGYETPSNEDDAKRMRIISPSPAITKGMLTSRTGCNSVLKCETRPTADDGGMPSEFAKTGRVAPRVMSGILTQAAFVQPMLSAAGSARSVSARIFQRVLCGAPSDFLKRLDSAAVAKHKQFVPNDGHLDDTKGCPSCHLNLDPVASVFLPNFLKNVRGTVRGEIEKAGFYGVRGGGLGGQGALFGEDITGVAQLGQKLAASREFHECTVKNTFQSLFGRIPQPGDLPLIDRMTDAFVKHADLKALIIDLASSPQFLGAQP